MCNLSEGIRESALREGIEKGIEKERIKFIKHLWDSGYKTVDDISDISGISKDVVYNILQVIRENDNSTFDSKPKPLNKLQL